MPGIAVDPGGETREEEQPAGGYPSDDEADAPPMELIADETDAADDDESEPLLEEAEAAVGDDCCVAVPNTAASMTAAADAAIAAHRRAKGYERPNAAQKKEETKLASEARKTWVEAQWLEPHTAADSAPLQCRNAGALALKNVLPGDGKITFVDEGHKYTAYGEAVHRSTTGVMADFFEKFDPVANTNQWYDNWKGNTRHKYYPIIKQTLDGGGSDEDAKAAICASWETLGAEASRLGTALHLHCEYALNEQSLPRDAEI